MEQLSNPHYYHSSSEMSSFNWDVFWSTLSVLTERWYDSTGLTSTLHEMTVLLEHIPEFPATCKGDKVP